MNNAKFWDADKFLSAFAFLISLGTFGIYIFQTHLIQKQQYASALPYIQIWESKPDAGTYKLVLYNYGVGPAFVKKIRITYKNKKYEYDPATFYQKIVFPITKDTMNFLYSTVIKGTVVPAGQEIDMLSVKNSPKDAKKLSKLFSEETSQIEVIYTSIYDETWTVNGSINIPCKLEN